MQDDQRARWNNLAFTSVGHFINDGSVTLVPVVADILVSESGIPLFMVTFMSVAFYSSSALLSLFVGRWADSSDRKGRIMTLGLSLLGLSFLGFGSAMAFTGGSLLSALAIIASIVAGFGSSFYHPLGATILQTSFSSTTKGKAMGVNGAFGAIGSTTFPSLFFAIVIFSSRSGALAVIAAVAFVAAVAIWTGLGEYRAQVKYEGKKGRVRDAVTKGIVILTVITAIRSISSTGVYFWLPTYITTVKGVGVGTALGLTISLVFVIAIPGQLVFGTLMDRFDKRLVLGVGSAGSALSIFGYVLTGGAVELVSLALFGFFTFTIFPTLLSLASEYVDESSVTSANALVWGIGTTGGNVIGPLVVGAIVGNNYPQLNLAFELMAAIGLVGALVTPLMPRPGRRARKTEV